MKFSRSVAYALQATLRLAEINSGEPVPCSRLAAEGEMPERFLLQILRHLVASGILGSARGVDGGYTLERRPDEISLLEVIEAVDGPLFSSLPLHNNSRSDARARLDTALREVTEVARRELEAIKLAHLLARPTRRGD